jgi:hypothetical protein
LHPTFLTDCLTLASSAATGKLQDPSIPWCIWKPLAIYFKHANSMQRQVFHISREVNGIALNLAHQVFSSSNEPQICCFASAHRHISCPVVALLSNLQVQRFMIHAIHCYWQCFEDCWDACRPYFQSTGYPFLAGWASL